MDATPKAKYQNFIRMLEEFLEGKNTSLKFVKEMETEFWACGLNEDDHFSDLMMALDMFGVPAKDFGYDEKILVSECRGALRLLKEEL